jgi:hypothetical protein
MLYLFCSPLSSPFDIAGFLFTILHSLLQARHRRPTIESLSRVDNINKFRFEGSAANEEAIDIGLESY